MKKEKLCLLHWQVSSLPLRTIEALKPSKHAFMLSRFSHVRLFVTLWTVAHQAPLSMGFTRLRILE